MQEEGRRRVRKGAQVPARISRGYHTGGFRPTEVSPQLIYKFLRDGRIEVAQDSPIALLCENCGVRITSGRFCVNCSRKLANEMIATGKTLRDALDKKKNTEEARGLRYLDEYRRDK